MQVLAEAESPAQAVEEARRVRPDVVLLDLHMPGGAGTAVIDDLRVAGAGEVLILTGFNVEAEVRTALGGGAAGFLLKHTAGETLTAAVRAVAAGEGWLDPAVTRPLLARFGQPDRLPRRAGIGELTERERAVLVLVARGRSNREIARELFIAESTVKTHLSSVLQRLEVRDRLQAAIAAYEAGLLDEEL